MPESGVHHAAVRVPHAILRDVSHRPWPLPGGPWIMFQRWEDLLFAHWRVPADTLRSLVPRELEIDEFDGSAYVSMTPFHLTNLRPRFLPAIPGASGFLEMNFRTYVRVGDKPGIWFFSLDAANRLAVAAARLTYRLPYRNARMRMRRSDGWIHYESRREGAAPAEFVARYRGVGEAWSPVAGTIEHFLTERYALYAMLGGGVLLRGEIHHPPWTVQRAEASIERNTVPAAHSLAVHGEPALLHYAAPQDTLIWPPVPLRP
jgi:uncharacterized protein